MLKTVVKKGNYHDSVVLMLLTNHISTIEGVNKASIMMATPANKDIFKQSGLDTEELMEASANDMVIVADIVEESVLDTILGETEEFFKKQQQALARINKIDPVTEVVNTNIPEQTEIDISNPLLDEVFDLIAARMGIHEEVLNYEPDEDDIYDEMPTEKTIRDFINLF